MKNWTGITLTLLGLSIILVEFNVMYISNRLKTVEDNIILLDKIALYNPKKLYLHSHLIILGKGKNDFQNTYLSIQQKDTLEIDTLGKYIYKDSAYWKIKIHTRR